MKSRAIIPLVLGLVIGVVAIRHFVNVLKEARAANATDTVQVVRARVDIGPTIEITEGMVELAAVPKTLTPRTVFTDMKEVVGRVTNQPIPQGMAVIPVWLAPKGTPAGMAARIPDGYRAVAVKVDEEQSVAGWIRPGARVDVVALMNAQRSGGSDISRVLLHNVEVLAVGSDIGTSGETGAALAKSVTLLVQPEGATKLHLATTRGRLRLVMRGQHDESEGEATSTLGDLMALGIDEPKAPPPPTDKESKPEPVVAPPEPEWAVEVTAGTMSSANRRTHQVVFDGDDADARRLAHSVPSGRRMSVSAVRRPPPPLDLSDDEDSGPGN